MKQQSEKWENNDSQFTKFPAVIQYIVYIKPIIELIPTHGLGHL